MSGVLFLAASLLLCLLSFALAVLAEELKFEAVVNSAYVICALSYGRLSVGGVCVGMNDQGSVPSRTLCNLNARSNPNRHQLADLDPVCLEADRQFL